MALCEYGKCDIDTNPSTGYCPDCQRDIDAWTEHHKERREQAMRDAELHPPEAETPEGQEKLRKAIDDAAKKLNQS